MKTFPYGNCLASHSPDSYERLQEIQGHDPPQPRFVLHDFDPYCGF